MIKFVCQYQPSLKNSSTELLVCPVFSGKQPSHSARQLDQLAEGMIKRLYQSKDIDGKADSIQLLFHAGSLKAKRVLLIGAGDIKEFDQAALFAWLQTASKKIKALDVKNTQIIISDFISKKLPLDRVAELCSRVIEQQQYQYQAGLSKKPEPFKLTQVSLISTEKFQAKTAEQALKQGQAVASGIKLAQELGDLPANICTPTYLAETCKKLAKQSSKASCKVLSEKQMQSLKMGSLLSVSAGSQEPAKLIALEYHGTKSDSKPHVLVGKGVTFDSGGISLKPAAKMEEMKYDMCGAAAVIGTMQAMIALEPEVNIVGLVGATENLPSGIATKPGDVVTSMSGQTIEVINTDAEGRLVLCDVLTYSQRYKPQSIVDIATLTGACVVALGSHASGLYSNQDTLAKALLKAGEESLDRAWHMPLWPEYDKQLESSYADMKNVGGSEGGSVTAACFLARFNKDQRWAHLDIAGTAWATPEHKGASGRPVALLSRYLLDQQSQ